MKKTSFEDFNNFMKVAKEIDLPLGLYTTNIEGIILSHNTYFEVILKHHNIEDGVTNCTDYFQNPADRTNRITWFEKKENQGKWNTDVLLLKNANDEIIVKDACYPILSEFGEILGFFGILIDIRDEFRFGRLFENLPIGLYQIDSEGKFVRVNSVVSDMLNYEEGELIGENVEKVYFKPEELRKVTDIINEPPYYVKDQRVELVKKDGEKIWASLNSFKIPVSGNLYYGREGTVIDITDEIYVNKLLFNVPVGFYIVKSENNTHIVEHCNEQFAKLFGYKTIKSVIGRNPEIFFENREAYIKYLDAIVESDLKGEPLWGFVFNGKMANNEIFSSEINSQLIRDVDDNIIGRVGVLRNISKENELRERITEITSDIGAVLHTYSTVLIQIRLYIEAVSQCFVKDIFDFKKQLDYQDVLKPLEQYRKSLLSTLDNFTLLLTNKKEESISSAGMHELLNKKEILKQLKTENIDKLKVPNLRYASYDILRIINKEKLIGIPREEIKKLKNCINDVLQFAGIIALHEMNDTVVDIEHQVSSFREFVTEEKREKKKNENIDVTSILASVITYFKEFAFSRNLEIRTSFPQEKLEIFAVANEINRAFSNILHNAIKYSYERKTGVLWIQIEVKKEADKVCISFENYGVPIHQKEIEKGFIFKMGYRGIYSTDRSRTGTGFGMNDTHNIITKKYKGKLKVESSPAEKFNRDNDYNQPFLTRVTIILNLINQTL
jgi:PAS domain S-box-containing protein